MNDSKHKVPYSVVTIDVMDAYPLADVFEEGRRYATICRDFASLERAIKLADRLFIALNSDVASFDEWIESDSGFDVRIYDKEFRCVYKAHTKLTK